MRGLNLLCVVHKLPATLIYLKTLACCVEEAEQLEYARVTQHVIRFRRECTCVTTSAQGEYFTALLLIETPHDWSSTASQTLNSPRQDPHLGRHSHVHSLWGVSKVHISGHVKNSALHNSFVMAFWAREREVSILGYFMEI